jgi:hypothetical protein
MRSELSFSFSRRRKFIQPKFTEDLQNIMALNPTVFEASNIGVNYSTAGARTCTMIRGPKDPRLIISTPKLLIACLERKPFSPAYSLAEALDLSPATVLSRLHNSLEMKNFHLRWVPYHLADDLRQVRVAKCGELLRALEAMQRTHSHHILTGDGR